MAGLLSREYAEVRRREIDPQPRQSRNARLAGDPWEFQSNAGSLHRSRAAQASPNRWPDLLSADTSYICAVDRWGNAFLCHALATASAARPSVPGLGFMASARGSQNWLDEDHPVQPGSRQAPAPHAEPRHGFPGWQALAALRHSGRRRAAPVNGAAVPQRRRVRNERPAGHRSSPVPPPGASPTPSGPTLIGPDWSASNPA